MVNSSKFKEQRYNLTQVILTLINMLFYQEKLSVKILDPCLTKKICNEVVENPEEDDDGVVKGQ